MVNNFTDQGTSTRYSGGVNGVLLMNKYGPKAQRKVEKNLHELKQGTLQTSHGQKVTNRKQAIAIALDETRREGGKVPNNQD